MCLSIGVGGERQLRVYAKTKMTRGLKETEDGLHSIQKEETKKIKQREQNRAVVQSEVQEEEGTLSKRRRRKINKGKIQHARKRGKKASWPVGGSFGRRRHSP